MQGFSAATQDFDLRRQDRVLVAIGDERRKPLNLRFRLQNRLMSAAKIVKMSHHRLDPSLDRKRFQHVKPYEVSQIADRFHRHGLMKEI